MGAGASRSDVYSGGAAVSHSKKSANPNGAALGGQNTLTLPQDGRRDCQGSTNYQNVEQWRRDEGRMFICTTDNTNSTSSVSLGVNSPVQPTEAPNYVASGARAENMPGSFQRGYESPQTNNGDGKESRENYYLSRYNDETNQARSCNINAGYSDDANGKLLPAISAPGAAPEKNFLSPNISIGNRDYNNLLPSNGAGGNEAIPLAPNVSGHDGAYAPYTPAMPSRQASFTSYATCRGCEAPGSGQSEKKVSFFDRKASNVAHQKKNNNNTSLSTNNSASVSTALNTSGRPGNSRMLAITSSVHRLPMMSTNPAAESYSMTPAERTVVTGIAKAAYTMARMKEAYNPMYDELSHFRFPPTNMSALADKPTLDETTLLYILGRDELEKRTAYAQKKKNDMAEEEEVGEWKPPPIDEDATPFILQCCRVHPIRVIRESSYVLEDNENDVQDGELCSSMEE